MLDKAAGWSPGLRRQKRDRGVDWRVSKAKAKNAMLEAESVL
jgi:hypothetical protein